ncbi:Protoporphyrinogen oxidase [Ramaria rubella]|nr:Protoporphyrinogen oxidase [Ramaria rubella]
MTPSKITIIGGGITGLSAAFHLSRKFPSSSITLLERSNRLGGWVQSKRVQFPIPGGDIGNVSLESGPRTLRPQSKALLEMAHQINLLDLKSELIGTPKNSPAAKNRFLYLTDLRKPGLTPIPTSLIGYFTSRLSLITIPSVIREVFRGANRSQTPEEDESFDSLMSRRFGPEFARVLGSALVHGIYAADSRKLSIRSAMAAVWDAETRGSGSVVKGFYRSRSIGKPAEKEEYEVGELEKFLKDAAVYSFRDGLQSLTDAIKNKLESISRVEIKTDIEVNDIQPISTSSGPLRTAHLVSTIPLVALHRLLSNVKLPHLTANPSSSVIVVTFVFASPPSHIHPPGFGYLIPRPKEGYENSTNPEGVLGVVFDSCSVDAQDRPRGQLTKMTMMLGGPYMPILPDLQDEETLGVILLGTLQRHLGRRLPRPAHIQITHQQQCIPTPTPGHLVRMAQLKESLAAKPWNGRMEVIGAGVGGVSVGDCVEQGRNAGKDWVI